MANKFKGQVTLTHEGQDYLMTLDFNALCDFEEATGKNALTSLEGMENGAITASDMRALMWAGLRQHHEDISLREAGVILASNADAVQRAAAAAMPEDGDAGNGKPTRTKRRVTGTRP